MESRYNLIEGEECSQHIQWVQDNKPIQIWLKWGYMTKVFVHMRPATTMYVWQSGSSIINIALLACMNMLIE
jgi:hypothetical protein